MKLVSKNLYTASDENIKIAIERIIAGEIIIYPTDTLYGFGADATNSDAISKINKIKMRQSPLSIIINDLNDINKYAKTDRLTLDKINNILPGPYTVLLKSKNNPKLSPYIQCDSDLIGIRLINNKFCNTIIEKINEPIVTTSVNMHGKSPMTDINKIAKEFKDISTFYNKKSLLSNGSTIIDFSVTPERVIRRGAGKY